MSRGRSNDQAGCWGTLIVIVMIVVAVAFAIAICLLLVQLVWNIALVVPCLMFAAVIAGEEWRYIIAGGLALAAALASLQNPWRSGFRTLMVKPLSILSWCAIGFSLVGWYPYLIIDLMRNSRALGSTLSRSGDDFFLNGSGTGDLIISDQLWESELLSVTREFSYSVSTHGLSVPELSLIAAIPLVMITTGGVLWGLSIKARDENEGRVKADARLREMHRETPIAAQQVQGAGAETEAVAGRRGPVLEASARERETALSRVARSQNAGLAEAQQQDRGVDERRRVLATAAAKQREAMLAASTIEQEAARTVAGRLRTEASERWAEVSTEVARQEAEAARRSGVALPGTRPQVGANVGSQLLVAAMATTEADRPPVWNATERALRELANELSAAVHADRMAATLLDEGFARAAQLEGEAGATRDAELVAARLMETEAARYMEPAHGADTSKEPREARPPLAYAFQQLEEAEGRRRAALADAAKRHEKAAQQRAAAIAEALRRQKLAAEQRKSVLAEATQAPERRHPEVRSCARSSRTGRASSEQSLLARTDSCAGAPRASSRCRIRSNSEKP